MRYIRCYETIIIPFLLGVVAVLTTLLNSGCDMRNIREDPNAIYRGYDGQRLPQDEVAIVWFYDPPIGLVTIDGKAADTCEPYRYCRGAELLPGQHTMEVYVRGYKSSPATINLDADLIGGHVYRMDAEFNMYTQYASDYAVSLIDEETGALVAGRPTEVLKWSYSDWEQPLQRLKRDSATKKKAIELLSEPYDRLPDDTLVYLDCPRGKGIIHDWVIYGKPPADCGFLFVEFDQINRVQGYTFIGVPFRECYQNPFTVRDAESWHREYRACRSRLKESAYVEFRAVTGNPAE